jgi:hypothetical protein
MPVSWDSWCRTIEYLYSGVSSVLDCGDGEIRGLGCGDRELLVLGCGDGELRVLGWGGGESLVLATL